VGSVDEVVARIRGELLIAGLRGKGRRIRIIARIRAGGGMTRTQQHTTRM
jgi:hypothetical protein